MPGIPVLLFYLFLAALAAGQGGPRNEKQLVHSCRPGPWGQLEYFYTYLEAPDHIMELVNTPSEKTAWEFPDKDLDEMRRFLSEAGMTESAIESTFQRSIPFQLGPRYRLYPPPRVVEELAPDCRRTIYGELRRHGGNRNYQSPVIIESGDVREWFSGSGLSPETVTLIERLSYRVGSALVFSDIPILLSRIKNDREERALLKALTRTRSIMVRLKVNPDSDFESLKDYWTVGNRNTDILPILESYANAPGLSRIDLAHLLPPTPRKYLYTFPSPELGIEGVYPDSFWTSLNFFRYLPSDDYHQSGIVTASFKKSYARASKPYRYGDILLLSDRDGGNARHACVFIADDIVYTKNGRSVRTPFMLMKLDDLLARFSSDNQPIVSAWRRVFSD